MVALELADSRGGHVGRQAHAVIDLAKQQRSGIGVDGLSRKRRPVFVNSHAAQPPVRRLRYIPLPTKAYGVSAFRRPRSRFVAVTFGVRAQPARLRSNPE